VPSATSSPPSCAALACWPGGPAGTWPRPPGSASPPSPRPNADKPFFPGVTAWADATRITSARRAVLLALAEAAANKMATFRIRLSSGPAAAQDPVRDLKASARVIRNFQPGIIPGLPQTAEYARQIMALAGIGHHGSHAAAAARLRRQEALHNPDRSFEFLLTEAALRYRPAPRRRSPPSPAAAATPARTRRSPPSSTT
jgi:Domain of unknown function (DUF5753)